MHDFTQINMELKIPGQRLISALTVHNDQIAKQITDGVEKAIQEFNFEEEVERQTKRLITEIIQKTMWGNELKKIVETKVNGIVQELVDREMKNWQSQNDIK